MKIKGENSDFIAIVKNGKGKKNEQYKWNGNEWVLHETDWAEIYLELSSHANISFEETNNLSIPVIEAIRSRLGKHISLKIGMPFSGVVPTSNSDSKTVINTNAKELNKPGEIPKIEDIMGFCSGFNGGG